MHLFSVQFQNSPLILLQFFRFSDKIIRNIILYDTHFLFVSAKT